MVMFMIVAAARQFLRRNHASIQHATAGVLKLDGRVSDAKMIFQLMVETLQDAAALRGRNVGNRHMARKRAGV